MLYGTSVNTGMDTNDTHRVCCMNYGGAWCCTSQRAVVPIAAGSLSSYSRHHYFGQKFSTISASRFSGFPHSFHKYSNTHPTPPLQSILYVCLTLQATSAAPSTLFA